MDFSIFVIAGRGDFIFHLVEEIWDSVKKKVGAFSSYPLLSFCGKSLKTLNDMLQKG